MCPGDAKRALCGWNSIYLVSLPGIVGFSPFNLFKLTIADEIFVFLVVFMPVSRHSIVGAAHAPAVMCFSIGFPSPSFYNNHNLRHCTRTPFICGVVTLVSFSGIKRSSLNHVRGSSVGGGDKEPPLAVRSEWSALILT